MAGPTLEATLSAKLDQLRADFAQAGDLAQQAVDKIEQTFKDSNPTLGGLGSALGGGDIASLLGLGAAGGAIGSLISLLQSANKEMAALYDNAKLVGLSIEDFQKFQFAANVGGLSSTDFAKGVTDMATKLNDSVRSENDLTKLLDANNITYKDDNDKLISMNQLFTIAANLIQNAATNLDKVKIADMLGLSKEWIPVLEQGGPAFDALANSATDAGAVIDTATIEKAKAFETAWNQSTARWNAEFKAETGEIAGYLDTLIDKAGQALKAALPDRTAQSPQSAPTGQTAAEYNNDQVTLLVALAKAWAGVSLSIQELEVIQDRYVSRGEAVPQEVLDQLVALKAKADAAATSVQALADAQYGPLQPYGPERPAASGSPTKIPGDDKDSTAAFDKEVGRLNQHTAQMDADSVSVGLNTGAHEQLRAELALLNAASKDNDDITVAQIDTYTRLRASMSADQALAQAGITLNKDEAATFDQVTQRAGQAGLAAAQAKAAFAAENQALQQGGDQVISTLDGIRTGSLSAAQALQQMINFLITAIEKAVLLGQGPLAVLFGTAAAPGSGGTGGIFGGLLGLSGGTTAGSGLPILQGVTDPLAAFAGGTDSAPGGLAIVGEQGPELLNLPAGAQITPTSALRSLAQSGGSGGNMSIAVSIDLTGANGNDTIARISRAAAAQGVAQAVAIVNQGAPARQMQIRQLGT